MSGFNRDDRAAFVPDVPESRMTSRPEAQSEPQALRPELKTINTSVIQQLAAKNLRGLMKGFVPDGLL